MKRILSSFAVLSALFSVDSTAAQTKGFISEGQFEASGTKCNKIIGQAESLWTAPLQAGRFLVDRSLFCIPQGETSVVVYQFLAYPYLRDGESPVEREHELRRTLAKIESTEVFGLYLRFAEVLEIHDQAAIEVNDSLGSVPPVYVHPYVRELENLPAFFEQLTTENLIFRAPSFTGAFEFLKSVLPPTELERVTPLLESGRVLNSWHSIETRTAVPSPAVTPLRFGNFRDCADRSTTCSRSRILEPQP